MVGFSLHPACRAGPRPASRQIGMRAEKAAPSVDSIMFLRERTTLERASRRDYYQNHLSMIPRIY